MGYVCSFLCLFIFLFSYIRHNKIYHPVTSFSLLFFVVTFMSSLRLYNFYTAPDIAYIIISCGVLFFSIGSILVENKRFVVGKNVHEKKYDFNKCMYYILLSICLLIVFPRFVIILSYLLKGNTIGDIYVILAASTIEEEELALSGLQNILMQFIGYPILYTLVPTSIVLFFNTYEKKFIIIAFILGIIRVLLDSRRTYLISFFLFLFIAFLHYKEKLLLNKKYHNLVKKIKKYIPLLLIAIILIFTFISRSRSNTVGQKYSSLGSFYNYYAGCVQYLGYCIQNYRFEHSYGFTTFRGLFSPIFGMLKIFGIEPIHPYQVATEIVNGMKYVVFYVAPNSRFNSFTTCFYQFYCDGGYIGIIFLSIIFGMFSQILYTKFIYDNQLRFDVKYLYYYGTILLLSFTNMLTVLAFVVWPLLIERLLYKKINKE